MTVSAQRLESDPNVASTLEGASRELRRCNNCGGDASGNYCADCGQESSLALPTAGRFLREAAGRYVAFDGRMWRSLYALAFRPGFLTREYLGGRRRRYVRPSRLFVALSIVVFAILRFAAGPAVVVDTSLDAGRANPVLEREDDEARSFGLRIDRDLNVQLDYASSPMLLALQKRIAGFNRLSREDKLERPQAGVLRFAPYAAIGLLPAFALLLEIAYAGPARDWPSRPRRYAAHLVFGAHNHAFLFLAVSLMVLVPLGPVRAALALWVAAYALVSMKAVYGGVWLGIVLRAVFIFAVYFVFFGLAIAALLLAAVALG